MFVSPLFIWVFMSLLIVFVLFLFGLLSSKEDESVNSNHPFECGMESIHLVRVPVSMHFFLVSILFLIFDMEFVICIPSMLIFCNFFVWFFFWYVYMLILILGLFVELFFGSLDWKD